MNLKFDKLTTDASKKLIGGFSLSMSAFDDSEPTKVNNCKGGNKKEGCGAKKRKKMKPIGGTNTNCSGNCVAGCGG